MLMKTSILLLSVLGAVHCDTGYSAPAAAAASGYGAPAQNDYAAPAQSGYGYQDYDDTPSYGAPADEGFDVGKFEELLPLFLAVLAAIILAQLLSPIISQLFVVLVGILPMALEIKAPIVNMILAPFDLGLCDISAAPVITLFPATARSFGEGLFTEQNGRMIADTVSTIFHNLQSK